MATTLTMMMMMMLFLPVHVYFLWPVSSHGGPRWCSQQLEEVGRHAVIQVLPSLLPCRVSESDISVELVNQQPHHVLVAMNSRDVERRVATY